MQEYLRIVKIPLECYKLCLMDNNRFFLFALYDISLLPFNARVPNPAGGCCGSKNKF